jgi:hypothetical protein
MYFILHSGETANKFHPPQYFFFGIKKKSTFKIFCFAVNCDMERLRDENEIWAGNGENVRADSVERLLLSIKFGETVAAVLDK